MNDSRLPSARFNGAGTHSAVGEGRDGSLVLTGRYLADVTDFVNYDATVAVAG